MGYGNEVSGYTIGPTVSKSTISCGINGKPCGKYFRWDHAVPMQQEELDRLLTIKAVSEQVKNVSSVQNNFKISPTTGNETNGVGATITGSKNCNGCYLCTAGRS